MYIIRKVPNKDLFIVILRIKSNNKILGRTIQGNPVKMIRAIEINKHKK